MTLSYWPAAEAPAVSSSVAEERTATTGSPSRASSWAIASRSERPTAEPDCCRPQGTTNPSGTGNPSRSSTPSVAALPPEFARVASVSGVSINTPINETLTTLR